MKILTLIFFLAATCYSLLVPCANAQWVKTNAPPSVGVRTFLSLKGIILAANYSGLTTWDISCSSDNGLTWLDTSGLIRSNNSGDILSFVSREDSVFAGYFTVFSSGILLSTDQGIHWHPLWETYLTPVLALTLHNDYLFAGLEGKYRGLDTGGIVYRSSDGGLNWENASKGLTAYIVNSLSVAGNTMYAATSSAGIFLSTNDGDSWASCNNGVTDTNILSLAVQGNRLYAGSADSGIFISTDMGASWKHVTNGFPSTSVKSFAFADSGIFAAAYDHGIYFSVDSGATWKAVNDGLVDSLTNALVVSGSYLIAGCDTSIWRRPLSEFTTGVRDEAGTTPSHVTLLQNYPNPFSTETIINYSLQQPERVSLKVYNSLGEEISTLVNGIQPTGEHTALFHSNRLQSGLYFYRIMVGRDIQTRTMAIE